MSGKGEKINRHGNRKPVRFIVALGDGSCMDAAKADGGQDNER